MRGQGPTLHPGLALGPRGQLLLRNLGQPFRGPRQSLAWPRARCLWQGQSGPGGSHAGAAVRGGRPPARLSPHFRMGLGPAVQVTADNISAGAVISHWQGAFFPKERQK